MKRLKAVSCGWLSALVALALFAVASPLAGAADKAAPAEVEKHGAPAAPAKADEKAKHGEAPQAEKTKPVDAGHHGGAAHHEPGLDHHDLSHANATPALGDLLQLRSDLAIYTLVVFVILLAVLWKFAWGPILEGLSKREQTIANQIAQANQAAAEAKALLAEHQAKVASASAEVRQMIEEGRRDAEASSAKIVAEANAAARRERDTALSQIDAAKNAALRELATKSVDTAIGLAGKIVGRQLTSQDHAQLVREATAQLPSSN